MAKVWLDQGAKRLHLVDLNGAFAGKPVNEGAVKSIVSAIGGKIPIQLGGGIRDLDTIERYLDDGIDYVILGTAAVKNPGFLHEACYAFPGQVIVGLDAKDGKVAVDGWSKMTGHDVIDIEVEGKPYEWEVFTHGGRKETGLDAVEWAKKMVSLGAGELLVTSMDRDGTKIGFNNPLNRAISDAVEVPLIASGGVGNLQHLVDGVTEGGADAVLAASIFHYGEYTVKQAKEY
ncbi:UNVERIFIED_CONTAM: hypothetical protein GTU68_014331, partial [Idotea baltica]|nr:hypothetical protein [Idotea baltica]